MNENEETYTTIYDVYERMGLDARIQPLRDGLMNVQSEKQLELAREFVNREIEKGTVSAGQLARRTGAHAGAISSFRNRKWKGSPGTLCRLASDLCKAINAIQRQREADATRIGGFVQTRVAEAIFSLVEYARKRRLLAAFCLPAGMGKSIALEAIRDSTPGAILLTATHTRGSVKSFLQLWARLLGVGEGGRAEDIQDRIVARLSDTDRLILVDECHKLKVSTLDVIREIFDACRCPIVLAGTPAFKTTLTSQRTGTVSRELLDQVYSRIGAFRDMGDLVSSDGGGPDMLATVEDIKKLFARGRVRLSRDGADFLLRLANTPAAGGFRRCDALVQIVIDMYAGQVVTAELLRQALAATIGTREAGFVAGRAAATGMEETATTAVAAGA